MSVPALGPLPDELSMPSTHYSDAPSTLYVVVFPNMATTDEITTTEQLNNAVALQCGLHNASYSAEFSYRNGNQDVQVSRLELLNAVHSVQDILPRSIINYGSDGQPIEDDQGRYQVNTTIIETLAYQSIMEAFGKLIIGQISTKGGQINSGGLVENSKYPTTVMSTALANTNELAFLKNYDLDGSAPSLQSLLNGNSQYDGHTINDPSTLQLNTSTTNAALLSALETMFQNITLSLLSSSLLQ